MFMKKVKPFFFTLLTATTFGVGFADDSVFLERGGIVAIEAESTTSRMGDWKKKTDVKDFSGECHLEFTGNKPESGPPKSPLKYSFKISKAGKYQLSIRARKRLETKREDISNDCFVALKGDFTSGGKVPLKVLKEDTKMFGGRPDDWGWTMSLDPHGEKFPAIYELKAGETYEFTISGRSKNFNIDRFIFVHESSSLKEVQRKNPPESKLESSGLGGQKTKRIKRSLTNSSGKSIQAELLGKEDDTVSILVKGVRHDVKISSLSAEDQKFIQNWTP